MSSTIVAILSVLAGIVGGWGLRVYVTAVSSFRGVLERLQEYEKELVALRSHSQTATVLLGKVVQASGGTVEVDVSSPLKNKVSVVDGEEGKVVISLSEESKDAHKIIPLPSK
jgi:stress response protein YsnF